MAEVGWLEGFSGLPVCNLGGFCAALSLTIPSLRGRSGSSGQRLLMKKQRFKRARGAAEHAHWHPSCQVKFRGPTRNWNRELAMASVRQQSPLVKPRVDGEERFGPPMGQWAGDNCL